MPSGEDNYRMDFWADQWSSDQAFWHIKEVNPILKKFENNLIPSVTSNTTIFFPLCGKTLDMLYFLEKGYNVVGVEGVETIILEYLNENGLKYDVLNIQHDGAELKVFVSGKLTLICGNYFSTGPLKPSSGIPEYVTRKGDAVFDRGSMMAILPELVDDYTKVLHRWVKPDGKVLLYAPEFDQNLRPGPPYSLSEKQVNQTYKDIANLEILETAIGKLFEIENVKHRIWLINFH